MIRFKEILLEPTEFRCDIWVGKISKKMMNLWKERYGCQEYEFETPDVCSTFYTTNDSELKGEKIIVIRLEKINPGIVTHEAFHAYHFLCKETGLETTYESQEWSAYFLEKLVVEILNKKNYKKV